MSRVPNVLSVLRCFAVLAVAILLLFDGEWTRAAALSVFVAAALTDYLDGYLARRFSAESGFGRMMDHIADKLLVVVTLLMLTADGTITGTNALAAALIIMRELAISGLREHVAPKGIVIPASMAGKWKTIVQLVAIAVLIAVPLLPLPVFGAYAGLALLWFATALTLVSGAQYVWGARGAI